MLTYNGSVPGLSLHVKQSYQFTCASPTTATSRQTVHWHGLLLENRCDGVPHETLVVQLPPIGIGS